jgi:aminopeptidase N
MTKRIILFLSLLPSIILYAQQTGISELEKEAASKYIQAASDVYKSDTTIDAQYYKLDLNIDDANKLISGSAVIKFKNLTPSKSDFFLDLNGGMTVDSITAGGEQLSFTQGGGKVFIIPHKELKQDEEYSVKIFYRGSPASTGFGSFVFSERNDFPAIWTLSEPYGAADWFPCKNAADKADSSEVWATVSLDLTAVSNGLLTAEIDNGNGTKTFKWKESYPIAHYLISLAIGNYEAYHLTFNYAGNVSMPVQNYVYRTELTPTVKQQLDKTLTALSVFSDLYGEYPFIKEKYGHAHFGWGGGMEHQTISSMVNFNEGIMIHELAHQWFGDKITCADWHEIWLNEGFATYSEGLYYERVYGKESYDMYETAEMTKAKRAVGTIYVQDISTEDEIFDGDRSYAKGGVVLHMLRGVVGDDTFFKIIKNYATDETHAYKTVTTADFQAAAEREYGQPLDYFFSEWIYGENYPVYSVNWNPVQSDGIYNTTITISQRANSNPSFFTMPLELRISFASGDTLVKVFNNQQTQTFTVQTKEAPVSLQLDPNNWILKDMAVIGVEDGSPVPASFRLDQNFPNPFNPYTKITFSIPQQGRVKITVYDSLGKEISVAKDEDFTAGEHSVYFNAKNLASGVYLYKLEWNDKSASKKMLVIK